MKDKLEQLDILQNYSVGTHTVEWVGPRIWNTMMAPHFPHIPSVPVSKRLLKQTAKQLIIAEYW